jgi:hypothetical protein
VDPRAGLDDVGKIKFLTLPLLSSASEVLNSKVHYNVHKCHSLGSDAVHSSPHTRTLLFRGLNFYKDNRLMM